MTTELQAAAVSIKHTEEHADTQKRIAKIERLRQIARNNYEVFSRRAEKLKDKFPEYAAECEHAAGECVFLELSCDLFIAAERSSYDAGEERKTVRHNQTLLMPYGTGE